MKKILAASLLIVLFATPSFAYGKHRHRHSAHRHASHTHHS